MSINLFKCIRVLLLNRILQVVDSLGVLDDD
jgi:hypothetical protein